MLLTSSIWQLLNLCFLIIKHGNYSFCVWCSSCCYWFAFLSVMPNSCLLGKKVDGRNKSTAISTCKTGPDHRRFFHDCWSASNNSKLRWFSNVKIQIPDFCYHSINHNILFAFRFTCMPDNHLFTNVGII